MKIYNIRSMEIFLSIIIFVMSLYLFFVTNNKIRAIKENLVIDDMKKEIESMLVEFNGAAVRNIELMESKINELQDLMNKANNKMTQLDSKIDRANTPFVIEKIVESAPPGNREKEPENPKQPD